MNRPERNFKSAKLEAELAHDYGPRFSLTLTEDSVHSVNKLARDGGLRFSLTLPDVFDACVAKLARESTESARIHSI